MSVSHCPLLPQSFYARDAVLVAKDLLGKLICHEEVVLRITETESYCWPNDSANHAHKGKTKRNLSMWGPAGHAYVYLCYGIHNMLNFVTNQDQEPAAVLIRSCEPIAGIEIVQKRRQKFVTTPSLLTGPGRVGQALAIDRSFSDHALFKPLGLEVRYAPPIKDILVGPRIGIDYASFTDRNAPYRFANGKSKFVSKRHLLSPGNKLLPSSGRCPFVNETTDQSSYDGSNDIKP
jgi:DNA-3-methyladenine glycosylase